MRYLASLKKGADDGLNPDRTGPGLRHRAVQSPEFGHGRRPGAGGWTLPWKTGGARHLIPPAIRAIERRWIAELADLADKSSGPGANDAYCRLFALAIARDLCIDAQPAAQSCLASIALGEAEPAAQSCSASIPSARDLRILATSVQVFARAEKGEYEQSLADLKALFKRPGCGPQVAAKSDAATAFAVGEAYFQRLIHSGRYDVARKLCELACKDDTPAALKDHFRARMARLELLERPRPVVSGNDVDGRHVPWPISKGKSSWSSSGSRGALIASPRSPL